MTDEMKSEETDKKSETKDDVQTETKAPEIPEHEVKAREMGWTPKAEFQGDPVKWVDAQQWIDRAPLFEEMKRLRKKAKTLEGTVNQLKGHYERVEENAYQRAVATLKQEKLQALESGDHKRVVEVDDELDKLRDRKPTPVAETKTDPVFNRWVEQNAWYENDPDMREYADFAGIRYAKENPEKSPEDVFDYAGRQTRKQFPDKFRNPKRDQPSSVEGGQTAPAKSSKPRWSDLPEHFQKAGDKFVRQGIMTRDQYIADLIKIGEIKP